MRVVNISSRVPMQDGEAPGGLAVGLLAALRARGGLWFGWNGDVTPYEPTAPEIRRGDGLEFATIPLPRRLHEDYYCGFANGTLWPLLHYFVAPFRYEEGEYRAYLQANALFALRVQPLVETADAIWVHDYQLIGVGAQLRTLGVKQPLGFFLHVPFPQYEVLRALPPFADLLQQLLAYDLVGFQTDTDRQSFLNAVRKLWGPQVLARNTIVLDDRTIRTGVFPIGVDVDDIAGSAARAAGSGPVRRTVDGLANRNLILGVDRLDPSKGLLERLRAYRDFLEQYPEQRGQVTYLQIAPLGRQNVRSYAEVRRALEQSAGRTNGRFADADWTPVRYLNRYFPHTTLMGFLRAAQVCLVTPLRDGMNLVAKEFVAAQSSEDPGVLVLSDRAGAACELTDALLVNPYDTRGIARALHRALTMSLEERRARQQRLLQVLRAHDVHRWYASFIEDLMHLEDASPACASGAGH